MQFFEIAGRPPSIITGHNECDRTGVGAVQGI